MNKTYWICGICGRSQKGPVSKFNETINLGNIAGKGMFVHLIFSKLISDITKEGLSIGCCEECRAEMFRRLKQWIDNSYGEKNV